MGFLLDIIIIAIIALTVFFAVKRGFIRTAISALSFVLAIIITAMFAPTLADNLKQTSIAESIQETTETKIESMISNNSENVYLLLNGENEEFNSLVKVAGLELDDLKEWYESSPASLEDKEEMLAERISNPIIDITASLLAVIVIFLGAQLVLLIVAIILDKVASLPILRTANKSLGLALGIILALFRVFLFCFIVDLLINNAPFIDNRFIDMLDPDNTILYSFFSKIDVFSFFI